MKVYFSAKRIAFYFGDYETIPDGLVEITSDVHQKMLNGQYGGQTITSDETGYPVLIETVISNEQQWEMVKQKRNVLLMEADWTQLPDVSDAISELYKPYRQSLRDITTQTDPFNIVWPIKPE